MKTAEEFIVLPIDREALVKHIESIVPYENKNQCYVIEKEALVGMVAVTDNECVYSFLPKKFVNGKKQLVYEVGVRIKTLKEDGYSLPMITDFFVDMPIKDLIQFLQKPESLKDFMFNRYDYNPRITTNRIQFLKSFSDDNNL